MINNTIFNMPIVKNLFRGLSLFLLKILGWQKAGRLPDEGKFVVIVAPHTTNWDLFYGILLAFAFGVDARFIAKNQLFRGPFSPLMKWLGGVPVDRSAPNRAVRQMIDLFRENKKFILGIAPEGTRHKAEKWKSGFYHIAVGARVPILLAFIDYKSKSGGAGPLVYPTGNIPDDMKIVADFYDTVTAKYPDKTSLVVIGSKT